MKTMLCLIVSILVSSCTSLLPVNSHYEKAGTLGEGNTEFAGNYTAYRVNHYEREEPSNNNFGFRAGLGLTKRLDLKFRYERLLFNKNFDGQLREADHIALVPKFALVPGELALLCPIGKYFTKRIAYGHVYREKITSIAPQMIFTFPIMKKRSDFSFSMKSDVFYTTGSDGDNDANMILGCTMGAGLSTNLDRWAIRPEIGISFNNYKEYYWNYGIGFQFSLPKGKN